MSDAPGSEEGAAASAEPTRDTRPKPEFGEYAPEGWEWKPEGEQAADQAAVAAPQFGEQTAAAAGPRVGSAPSSAPSSASSAPQNLAGVPHNLGAGLPRKGGAKSAAPAVPVTPAADPQSPAGQAPTQQAPGAPYRAGESKPEAPFNPQFTARGMYQGAPGDKPRTGDRITTILLLVLGFFGAIQSAFALMALDTAFVIFEGAPGLETITVPEWAGLTGKIAGMVLLVLYGLVLVFSIRRLRARKLAFWAPLIAGVVATIAIIVIFASVMSASPELMKVMTDPVASAELQEYLWNGGAAANS